MATRQRVSICIDDLFAASKAGHKAITTGKNGKKYAAVDIWHNDQLDKFGNDWSVQLYDADATPKATYIGNGKTWENQQANSMKETHYPPSPSNKQTPPNAAFNLDADDMPF